MADATHIPKLVEAGPKRVDPRRAALTAGAGDPRPATALLQERFGEAIGAQHAQHGDETVVVSREQYKAAMLFLRDEPRTRFEMMVDLTAVDYLDHPPAEDGSRYEVVVHLKSITHGHRLRVKVPVPGDEPQVETISDLWVAADWYERECWDMYGIRFAGHPKLKRLLMWDEFVGHPLRKDYDTHLQQPLVPMRAIRERHDYLGRVITPEERERLAAGDPPVSPS